MRRSPSVSTVAATASAQTGSVAVGTAPGKGVIAQTVKATATITAIDTATRDITLKGPQGNELVVTAGPEVKNFASLKVGDQVDLQYVEALTLELKKGGGMVVSRSTQSGMAGAKPGETPAGAVGRQVTIVADVVGARSREASRHAQGTAAYGRPAHRGSRAVQAIAKGDQVEATFTQAFAVAVEPRSNLWCGHGRRRPCRGRRPPARAPARGGRALGRRVSDSDEWSIAETLKNGVAVTIRTLRASDRDRIADAVRQLDRDSIYTRLFTYRSELTDAGLDRIMAVDPVRDVMLVVTVGAGARGEGHRIGPLHRRPGRGRPRSGEIAFIVEEDYQGLGIAGRLVRHLADLARARGVATFEADVLGENKAMLAVFARSGLPMRQRREGGVVHVTLSLAEAA